ncbi:hypothetical protein Cgig2_016811 [Carnegiea gigantea]|uniref:GDSL esterase/lipase n=1 Tax=Carnegiea gigantea TaxID=171969 RepID=A0A9Q1GUT0_9CARY|nr:hypothetical protein Cgig2_016811 [Carnegiea gigantea]
MAHGCEIPLEYAKHKRSREPASVKGTFEKSILPRPGDFSKGLYTLDIGQNDLSVGFRTMTNEQLRTAIIDIVSQFSSALQHLYEQGARSFWVHNTGPIGCLPVAVMYITQPQPGYLDQYGCIKGQNDMVIEFNKQLKDAVQKLRTKLPEAAITYVDLYAAKYGLISKAKGQVGGTTERENGQNLQEKHPAAIQPKLSREPVSSQNN